MTKQTKKQKREGAERRAEVRSAMTDEERQQHDAEAKETYDRNH